MDLNHTLKNESSLESSFFGDISLSQIGEALVVITLVKQIINTVSETNKPFFHFLSIKFFRYESGNSKIKTISVQ